MPSSLRDLVVVDSPGSRAPMIATAVLVAQYAGTLDLIDTTRVDARATQPAPLAPPPPQREIILGADVSTTPMARLRLRDRHWDYAFTYAPTLAATDVELGTQAQPVLANTGTVSIGWHDRFFRMTVSQSGSYGLEDVGYLYATRGQGTGTIAGETMPTMTGQTGTTTPGQTSTTARAASTASTTSSPTLSLFPFATSNSSATLRLLATRQLAFSLSGGYFLAGALTSNPSVAPILPEQFGPFGAASVAYTLSRSDSLATTASAQETTTPLGACFPLPPPMVVRYCRQVEPIVQVQETERHRVSTNATLTAGVGAAASIDVLTNEQAWVILPTAVLTYSDRIGALDNRNSSVVLVTAQVAPTTDINGAISNRLQISATLGHPVAPNVFLNFSAGALQSIPPDPYPLTAVNGGADLRFRVTRQVDVTLGVQGFLQKQAFYTPPGTQTSTSVPASTDTTTTSPLTASEVGYVMLTARVPTLRF